MICPFCYREVQPTKKHTCPVCHASIKDTIAAEKPKKTTKKGE